MQKNLQTVDECQKKDRRRLLGEPRIYEFSVGSRIGFGFGNVIVVCEISLIKFLRYSAIPVGRASRNYYDVWLPDLAPSEKLLKLGQAADEEKRWRTFARKYRAEMYRPEKRRLLDLLAAMSRQTNFSVGCYCADESRCHRSLLRALLAERGALFA
ncbi:MAG: DUF488 family protein [Desulfuromonadales bacterium]